MSLPDYKAYQAHVGITNPEMTEELQKVGLAGKQIVISHCMNEKDARDLMNALLAVFPDVKVLVQPTRGLDSFYAERGGLIVGY